MRVSYVKCPTFASIVVRLQAGARVLATITDAQIRQAWKEGERWERSLWDGRLVRQKTWQTSYDVTAEWMHAQTKQSYLLRSKVWADEVAKAPHRARRLSSLSTFVILSALLWTYSPSPKRGLPLAPSP